jgi:hypothetical protein
MVARELNETEVELQEKFEREGPGLSRLPSTAQTAPQPERLDQLFLPVKERGRIPLTKDRYVVRDNPHEVAWERQVRMFLRLLSLDDSHRVSAGMIYEWATGIKVVDYIAREGSAPPDLRRINKIMRFYFTKAYSTWIAGKKVENCYRIPQGWRVKRHRPMTLTLWNEYQEGVLNDDGARRNAAQLTQPVAP